MPYLVVLGGGSWWAADGNRYNEGVHMVSQETADAARASGIRSLVVSDTEPTLVTNVSAGPLSLDDIKFGVQPGLRVVGQTEVQIQEEEEPYSVPLDYPCSYCELKFPSGGSRDRHVEMHHMAVAQQAKDDVPAVFAAEPLPEGVNPEDENLHPSERLLS